MIARKRFLFLMKANYFVVIDDQTIDLRRIRYLGMGSRGDQHVAHITDIRDKKTLKELINFLRGSGITDDEAGISERFAK
jgi:hypothetical protein